MWIRLDSHARIEKKFEILVNQKLLTRKRNSIFNFYGEIGSKNPQKVVLLQSGVHGGLELFAIEVLLDKIAKLDLEMLEEKRIKVIVIPIVNQYGFDNSKRTNENGVDLARNSGYITTHLNKIPFVVGWSFYNIFMIITVLLTGKTWYNKGFNLQRETDTLMRLYRKNLRKYKDNFFCFDFHTGNTSGESRLFFQELYKQPHVSFINTLCSETSMHIEMIDYGTDGGFFEKVALDTGINFNAFTVELAVIAKYTHKKYVMRYFFHTVFEPTEKEYEQQKKEADKEIDNIFSSVI